VNKERVQTGNKDNATKVSDKEKAPAQTIERAEDYETGGRRKQIRHVQILSDKRRPDRSVHGLTRRRATSTNE